MILVAFLSAITFAFLGQSPVYGQQTMDFQAALEHARNMNPDWRAAEQEVEISRGKLTTARLINPFNPEIEGEVGRRTITGERSDKDYGVGLSMELEVAGQRGKRIAEAQKNLEFAEASLMDFRRTFRAKLARSFYQATFARERLALVKRVEALNLRLFEVTRAKFEAGDVSGLEVNVATVRHGRSRKNTLDAERDLNQALLELRRLVGAEQPISPMGELSVTSPPVPLKEVLDRALSARPDLLASRSELERAEAEIALVKRETFPNPTLGFFYNREGSDERIIGGRLSFPLPLINRRQGDRESLEARRVQARAKLSALEQEIRKEVEQVVNQWDTALQGFTLFQEEILKRTEENFRLLESAYRERKIDFPQLLIMENDLTEANLAYLDASLALREAAIQLEEVAPDSP